MNINVKVKLDAITASLPTYATAGSACCDVRAAHDAVVQMRGGTALIGTGLFLEVPDGYECQIRPRSGLALKHCITVLNSPGTLDSDYRGELKILLINHSCYYDFNINSGDRIAQIAFVPVTQATFDVVDELNETERGEGGFGSTGVAG
jgi:dUTP pyrophosphatase